MIIIFGKFVLGITIELTYKWAPKGTMWLWPATMPAEMRGRLLLPAMNIVIVGLKL
jgi:hypothetical protein